MDIAASVIDFEVIPYYTFSNRHLNEVRQWVTGYSAPTDLTASVQMVPRSKYVQYGLEMQRNYVKIYASAELLDLRRDASGDQFIWGNRLYQVESQNTWRLQDGWATCLAVDIGPSTDAPVLTA